MWMRSSFRRDVGVLNEIFDFVREFFSTEQIDREHLFAVDLVVEEVFTNLVKYNQGTDHDIDICLDRNGDEMAIRLIDRNVDSFDLTQAVADSIDKRLEERPIGGLGIHLVHKLMDEIDYEYADRQSTITLTKKLKGDDV